MHEWGPAEVPMFCRAVVIGHLERKRGFVVRNWEGVRDSTDEIVRGTLQF